MGFPSKIVGGKNVLMCFKKERGREGGGYQLLEKLFSTKTSSVVEWVSDVNYTMDMFGPLTYTFFF